MPESLEASICIIVTSLDVVGVCEGIMHMMHNEYLMLCTLFLPFQFCHHNIVALGTQIAFHNFSVKTIFFMCYIFQTVFFVLPDINHAQRTDSTLNIWISPKVNSILECRSPFLKLLNFYFNNKKISISCPEIRLQQ